MAKIGLSAPWDIYYKKLKELFKRDPMIHMVYDMDAQNIKLYANSQEKAVALAALLPDEQVFGKVHLKITVVPPNDGKKPVFDDDEELKIIDLVKILFEGNDAVSYFYQPGGVYAFSAFYVVFKHEIVQYYTDNLSDINGFTSTLYQELARELLEQDSGVFYCTDVKKANVRVEENRDEESFGAPLGEWP